MTFPKGASLAQIADTLQEQSLIQQPKLFVLWAKMLGYEKKIKAGMFEIPVGLNYPQLIAYIGEAKPLDIKVTLIEGWTSAEITSELSRKLNLYITKLDSLVYDSVFCMTNGIHSHNMTGYLLPDTYTFPFGISEQQVLSYLAGKTLALFESDSARNALEASNYSAHQIITLASIVEGEAIIDDERSVIASVYWNRLKRRMRLQADPTIQFILKDGPRRLLYKDLEIDSPYNTYKYAGLPPGPINNPGKASILATLFPEQSKFYFFVARGDGSHVFSRNSAEHARAKAEFNKLRREVARKNRYQNRN